MIVERKFWQERVCSAWREVPIVWLSGVRRSGKTTLAQQLAPDDTLYLNCDLPSIGEMVRDPQLFFRHCNKPIVVLDEVHQLRDPSRLLKVGADEFPQIKILATGSSTLGASNKFSDSLTGRKRTVHLTPVLERELADFGTTLPQRIFQGGLPPALMSRDKKASFYQ